MTEDQRPKSTRMQFGLGIGVGAAVVGLFWFGTSGAGTRNLAINIPGAGSISMEAANNEIDQEEVLNTLWGNEGSFTRSGMIGWLADKGIYELTSLNLVQAIENDLCGPIPDSPLDERIERGQECAAKVVARQLRELAQRKSPPFHYVGVSVQIGISLDEEHRPPDGRANACSEGEFSGRSVQLTNPLNDNQIIVLATGTYPCSGIGRTPDLQINEPDATELFDGPLDKYETVIAVILN